jgi:hypothetical protein
MQDKLAEIRSTICQEMVWIANLSSLPCVHHSNAIAIHNRVQSMCNGDDSAVCKLRADCVLNQGVRVIVNIGSGLVQDEHAGFPRGGDGGFSRRWVN